MGGESDCASPLGLGMQGLQGVLKVKRHKCRAPGRGVCDGAGTFTVRRPEGRRGWSDKGAGLNVRKGAARSEFATLLRPRTAARRLLGRGVCYPASGIGEEEALETAGPAPTIIREQPEGRRGWSDEGAGLNVRKGAARSEFATLLRPRTAARRLLGRGVCYPASGIGEEEALETAGPAPTITREQPEGRRGWSDEGAGLNVRKGATR